MSILLVLALLQKGWTVSNTGFSTLLRHAGALQGAGKGPSCL